MNGRIAIVALAVLAVGGISTVQWIADLINTTQFDFRGEPDEEMMRALAFQSFAYTVVVPLGGTVGASSVLALAVIGARSLAEAWTRRRTERLDDLAYDASAGDAHEERTRVDAELGRDH